MRRNPRVPQCGIGKPLQNSATSCRILARAAESSLLKIARSTKSATFVMSDSFSPRVVSAGVPSRRPLVTFGGRGSFGTPFLLAMMPAVSRDFSASACGGADDLPSNRSRSSAFPRPRSNRVRSRGRPLHGDFSSHQSPNRTKAARRCATTRKEPIR